MQQPPPALDLGDAAVSAESNGVDEGGKRRSGSRLSKTSSKEPPSPSHASAENGGPGDGGVPDMEALLASPLGKEISTFIEKHNLGSDAQEELSSILTSASKRMSAQVRALSSH